MKQEIINKINSTRISEKSKKAIINGLTERYLIETQKTNIQMGSSKIGGYPHLPKDFEYPQEDTYFYEFLGQINLSDLIDNNITDFPKEGIMYFFIDDDFKTVNINTKIFVLNTDHTKLEIKKPPIGKKSRCEAFLYRTEFTELKLQFIKSYTIEQNLLDKIVFEQNDTENNDKDFFDIEQFYSSDQIGGFTPTWGIGEADWSAYLSKRRFSCLYWFTLDHQIKHLKKENIDIKQWLNNKIDEAIINQKEILDKNDKSAYIYSYWEKDMEDLKFAKLHLDTFANDLDYHKQESKKWKMILSLSSYTDAKIAFGDGKIEFYIHSDDLINRNYHNIYCHVFN